MTWWTETHPWGVALGSTALALGAPGCVTDEASTAAGATGTSVVVVTAMGEVSDAGSGADDSAAGSTTGGWFATPGRSGLAPDASMCERLTHQVSGALHSTSSSVDRSCSRHDECVIVELAVSCLDDCHYEGVSHKGANQAEAWSQQTEAAQCAALYEADCTEAFECEGSPDSVARCLEGECGRATRWCPADCSPDAQEVCRGDAACDGCPAIPDDVEGLPCDQPGLDCVQDRWCPNIIRCEEDPDSGALLWRSVVLLC